MFIKRVNKYGRFTGGQAAVRGQISDGHTVAQTGGTVATATMFLKDSDSGREWGLTINRKEHELFIKLFEGKM